MKKFTIKHEELEGLMTIEPKFFEDDRGYFCETWNYENLKELGFDINMWQDNQSLSGKNVLRGLHYQWDKPMGKLVRVVKGSVYDVCVDIRKDSPTFGKYFKVLLSEKNKKQLWVPAGFAHGILSLEEDTIVLYKCSNVYNQKGESGVHPFDKQLDIDWGIPIEEVILSTKDREAQSFLDYKNNPKF